MTDVFDKIDRLMSTDLGQFAQIGHGYFTFPKLTGEIGPRMNFQGREVLNWSLNDYLGLANHPEVRATDAQAAAQFGFAAPMGSRMLTGNTDLHEQFEREAAAFTQKEDAFLVNFGYQACLSIIHALTDRKDVIVYDQLSHACIIDGMNLSLAKRFVFAHNDMAQLEDRLRKAQAIVEKTGGGILVITEGVFGMKGDTGDLAGIVALKQKYNFRLLIDDAHGFGVMGPTGAGTGEHYGVQQGVDLYFTTFAKSMAMIGGFVSGDHKVIHFLRYNLRSQIYAKSMPAALVVGALKRLELIRNTPELRERLWANTRAIQNGLRERGMDLGNSGQTPVTSVVFRAPDSVVGALVMDVRENMNLFLSTVTYPVIERGYFMLRIIPTAAHTPEDVQYTLDCFAQVNEKLLSGYYEQVGTPVARTAV
jgi:glycine C-acetyltransferase